jgi:2'-5' RNA ligase
MGNRVYVSGNVKDELRIKQIRNTLWTRTNAAEYYQRKHPHVTIVPAFQVKDSDVSKVKSIVNDVNFEGENLEINTLCLYENLHKPYVVQLNVRHNMEDKIETLINDLEELTGSNLNYPASLHITLFKTKGWWDTVPVEMSKRLQDEVMFNQFPDTQISDVRVDVK